MRREVLLFLLPGRQEGEGRGAVRSEVRSEVLLFLLPGRRRKKEEEAENEAHSLKSKWASGSNYDDGTRGTTMTTTARRRRVRR